MTPREIAERFPPDSKVEISGKTDHTTITIPQYSRDQLAAIWNAAVAEEREACAKIAEELFRGCYDDYESAGDDISVKIRARKP